jgi:8-oxo-dGTP diphosphatase
MTKHIPAPEHLRFATLAADTALFTLRDGKLLVRITAVNRPPFYVNAKGLPGGLLHPKETAEQAAVRHLEEKAGIEAKKTYAEQLYTFSRIDRDPRNRVVAVAYLALVPWTELSPLEQADSKSAWWAPIVSLRKLAYDHDEILKMALGRLASRVTYSTLISKLMPKEFTLTELEKAYEGIITKDLDKRNFRKKILKVGVLKALPHKKAGGRFRPAQLYRFVSSKVTGIEVL